MLGSGPGACGFGHRHPCGGRGRTEEQEVSIARSPKASEDATPARQAEPAAAKPAPRKKKTTASAKTAKPKAKAAKPAAAKARKPAAAKAAPKAKPAARKPAASAAKAAPKAAARKPAAAAKTAAKKPAAAKTAARKPAAAKAVAKKAAPAKAAPRKASAAKAAPKKAAAPAAPRPKRSKARPPKVPPDKLARLVEAARKSLEDDKAENIVVLDVTGRADYADRLIIASGLVDRQLQAMAAHLDEALAKEGLHLRRDNVQASPDWVLIDAGDLVIHLFLPDARELYRLEKMWGPGSPDREALTVPEPASE